tara:strand:+ start:1869 stop:3044 length:1176 start_codon:yes stop_codon:yes gene_type:complete
MHIVEAYATHCGLKIDKPWMYENYYPIEAEDYITIQPFGGAPVRDYDYWDEVLFYLAPVLSERKIQIVQLGVEKDRALDGCLHTQGQTNMSQLAYLIKGSMLHLGVDSVGVHLASSYGKKIVGLYCNQWTRSSGPYWSNPKDVVLHEPNRDGVKPSFLLEEHPKTINEISPEKIAQSVLDLLGIDHKIPFERLHVGVNYPQVEIQNVPSSVARVNINGPMIVRMDLEFDEKVLASQLGLGACVIVTNKPLNRGLLTEARMSIANLVYYLDENHDPDFVKFLHQSAIRYTLLTELDEKDLNKIKMDYLDFGFIHKKSKDEKGKKKLEKHDVGSLLYKTKKKILKDGKCYNSSSNLNNNVSMSDTGDFSFTPVIDEPEFWRFLDESYVVKKLD